MATSSIRRAWRTCMCVALIAATSVMCFTDSFGADRFSWHHLLDSVKHVESHGNRYARSSEGALGHYQFMPQTARRFHIDPFNPQQARWGAKRYLTELIHEFGDVRVALAAWNWGPGNVQKSIDRHGHFDLKYAPRETQHFVARVMTHYHRAAGEPEVVETPTTLRITPPPVISFSLPQQQVKVAAAEQEPPMLAHPEPSPAPQPAPAKHAAPLAHDGDEEPVKTVPPAYWGGHKHIAVWYKHHTKWHFVLAD